MTDTPDTDRPATAPAQITAPAKPARKRASRSAKPRSARKGKSETAPSAPGEVGPRALFCIDFDVRWRDLDAFNHVNNSTFLTYLEEARLRWLESLDGPWLTETSAPVLASAELQFRRPIPWPESVRVELRTLRVGQSSLTLGHRICSSREAEVVYCEGQAVMVWVDAHTGKGATLPEAVRLSAEATASD